ncbi:hypothetical protein YC2023_036319 [Brassica napus]
MMMAMAVSLAEVHATTTSAPAEKKVGFVFKRIYLVSRTAFRFTKLEPVYIETDVHVGPMHVNLSIHRRLTFLQKNDSIFKKFWCPNLLFGPQSTFSIEIFGCDIKVDDVPLSTL